MKSTTITRNIFFRFLGIANIAFLLFMNCVRSETKLAMTEDIPFKVRPIAQDYSVVYRSKHPKELFTGSPSIIAMDNGRLIASLDLRGPGLEKYCTGPTGQRYHFREKLQGLIFTSDDQGKTWTQRAKFPYCHARLLEAGGIVYLLGHKGNIMIMKSEDGGTIWSEPVPLTDPDDKGGRYTQAPANVLKVDGQVYLLMMYITDFDYRGYFISTLGLVGMHAPVDADLTHRENWTFSEPTKAFRDFVPTEDLDYFGIPFYDVPDRDQGVWAAPGRRANRLGWHEAHLLQIKDPNHFWYDKTGSTFHVLARADAHLSNMAALAVMHEDEDGSLSFDLQKTPAGTTHVFLPLPGGNIKFHVFYDEKSKLYWLLANQVTDSMTVPDALSEDGRFGLPLDQRERLALYFSKNLVDWQFAALVATGETSRESRGYASMDMDGDDLCILSRSGSKDAKNAHDTDMITFHRVKDFRQLAY